MPPRSARPVGCRRSPSQKKLRRSDGHSFVRVGRNTFLMHVITIHGCTGKTEEPLIWGGCSTPAQSPSRFASSSSTAASQRTDHSPALMFRGSTNWCHQQLPVQSAGSMGPWLRGREHDLAPSAGFGRYLDHLNRTVSTRTPSTSPHGIQLPLRPTCGNPPRATVGRRYHRKVPIEFSGSPAYHEMRCR